jgi:hypothetical protein
MSCELLKIKMSRFLFKLHVGYLLPSLLVNFLTNKGNNKITKLRTILQRESQNS